jgi:hypothetical protein
MNAAGSAKRPPLAIPGRLYVAPTDPAVVELDVAAGWMTPKGVLGWTREVSVVSKADLSDALRRELNLALPHEHISVVKHPTARRAAQANPVAAVSRALGATLSARGVRVHTIGYDKVTANFFYFSEGGTATPVHIQGDLLEMIAPVLAYGNENDDIARHLARLIDRIVSALSGNALTELRVELADALPPIATKGSITPELDAFEKEATALTAESARWRGGAESLASTLESAGTRKESRVPVHLFGEATRLTRIAMDLDVGGTRIALPSRTLWVVSGEITDKPPMSAPPPPAAEVDEAWGEEASAPAAKPAAAKPAETKPTTPKPAETKPAETKPAETKPAEKPAEKPATPKQPAVQPAQAKAADARPVTPKPAETKPVTPAQPAVKPAEAKPTTPKQPEVKRPTPAAGTPRPAAATPSPRAGLAAPKPAPATTTPSPAAVAAAPVEAPAAAAEVPAVIAQRTVSLGTPHPTPIVAPVAAAAAKIEAAAAASATPPATIGEPEERDEEEEDEGEETETEAEAAAAAHASKDDRAAQKAAKAAVKAAKKAAKRAAAKEANRAANAPKPKKKTEKAEPKSEPKVAAASESKLAAAKPGEAVAKKKSTRPAPPEEEAAPPPVAKSSNALPIIVGIAIVIAFVIFYFLKIKK